MSKYDKLYMKIANDCSEESKAKRRKVGAILVKNTQIISEGWNGTPAGFDNNCETLIDGDWKTKPEVLHAESNAITKCAKHGNSTDGATLYVTCAPCVECSKLIIQAGIKEVIYRDEYHDTSGLELLRKANIKVIKYGCKD